MTIHPGTTMRMTPAEAEHTDDTGPYRRATNLLATFDVISSDVPRRWGAIPVRGILIHILLKVRRGHDRPEPITQGKWPWAPRRADECIEAA